MATFGVAAELLATHVNGAEQCEDLCRQWPFLSPHLAMLPYNSFSPPVIISTTLFGAGPTPSTVALPLAICVLPAS